MIRPASWPDLDRLARFVRVADTLTGTLAAWTGHEPVVEILSRVDGTCPAPSVADSLNLPEGARVQERTVLVRCGDAVVATARSLIAADSPALTPKIRTALRGGSNLGDLLRCLHHRRVAVQVTTLRDRPAREPTAPVLAVQARLDVGGTPVAWCEETVFEAVFLADGRPARPRRLRVAA